MMQKMKQKYRTLPVQVKASLWFLICSFMQKGISTISTPIFTRLLNTSEYGQYSVFNSWLGIISIFVTLNLSAGVYNQGLVKYEEQRNVFSSSLQGLSTTLTIVWTIVYLTFHNFWNKIFSLTTVQMLAMLVMIWTTAVFNFWAAEQRVNFKYRNLVLLSIAVSLAKPIVGIVFVINARDKVTARILGLMLVELIGYTALFFVQIVRGKKFYSARFWKYALAFNIPLVPHYLSQTVLSSADRIMISNMCSGSAAGIYSLAYSISLVMTLFNTALMQTISPWIYQKIKNKKINDISSIAYISLICIAVVNIILIAFAPEAVAFFAPSEYYEAIWVIPPVAMSVYFMYCYDLFAKFAFYYEKTKFIMIASVVGAILNIVLNYIFIKLFGYVAAGYTTLGCYIIYSICHYIFMKRVCTEFCNSENPYSLRKIMKITIPFMAGGFLLLFTYQIFWVRYSIIVISVIVGIWKRRQIMKMLESILALRKKVET